jgi:hypothetical protein
VVVGIGVVVVVASLVLTSPVMQQRQDGRKSRARELPNRNCTEFGSSLQSLILEQGRGKKEGRRRAFEGERRRQDSPEIRENRSLAPFIVVIIIPARRR